MTDGQAEMLCNAISRIAYGPAEGGVPGTFGGTGLEAVACALTSEIRPSQKRSVADGLFAIADAIREAATDLTDAIQSSAEAAPIQSNALRGCDVGVGVGRVGRALTELATMPADTIVDERELARLCGLNQRTLKRMVERGELPMPSRFAGSSAWTSGGVLEHFKARATENATPCGGPGEAGR